MNSRQEKNFPVIPTAAGPIKICTLWDFLQEVKRHKLHPDVAEQLAIMQKNEMYSNYQYRADLGVVSESIHTLKQNPMRVISELKKTTGSIEYRGKNISFRDILEDTVYQAMTNYGIPTHFFAVGKSRFALVQEEDISMYVGADYNQTLVCHRKDRNFTIYTPNIKLEF